MEESMITFQKWCDELSTFQVPKWDELPDFELYMDQVITYIEKHLRVLSGEQNKLITQAMINNYVKLKLMPAPNKKKYAKKHLAFLIAITILKQVITISEIKDGIQYLFLLHGEKKAYDLFCEEQERALQDVIQSKRVIAQVSDKEPLEHMAMRMAAISFANKIVAEKVISIQREFLEQHKDKKKGTRG